MELGKLYEEILLRHLAYCRENQWAGIDPYDALNSELFKALPFLDFRLPRLVLTQVLKRSPINIRKLLLIPKTQNPKALALFLSAFQKTAPALVPDREALAQEMIQGLIGLRSKNTPYWCWGYSFPWQGRNLLVPRGAPNLVCTYFVANSLLDVYERTRDARLLDMAASAAEYILNELYWTDGPVASFSYPLPSLRSVVYNANLLAAALFFRVSSHTGERKFIEPAMRATHYAAGKQRADGSWAYGEGPSQQWADNFHTGYNLCALQTIAKYGKTDEFDSRIERGLEFYKKHFFREDGAVGYFHDRFYPIDTHCIAQALITLVAFKDQSPENIPLAQSVFRWTLEHMWDEQGFFYYRVHRRFAIRTSYMRWTQVWMFLALATLAADSDAGLEAPAITEATAIEA